MYSWQIGSLSSRLSPQRREPTNALVGCTTLGGSRLPPSSRRLLNRTPHTKQKAMLCSWYKSLNILLCLDDATFKINCFLLLKAIDNGRLVDTDTYFDHLELVENPLKVLLITNKYVMSYDLTSTNIVTPVFAVLYSN